MSSTKKLKAKPREGTARARNVLEQARESKNAFLGAFEAVRERRGATSGTPTDEEQDLLRAALVFSGAGLDSALKELIRGTIRLLATIDPDVQRELEVFVGRQLRGESQDPDAIGGRRFLAKVLVSTSPQDQLIDEYILELTGTSLQSPDQLLKATKALGLDPGDLGIVPAEIKPIFDVRNMIIHELDVNFEKTRARRYRNSRKREVMEAWSTKLLDIAECLIEKTEGKLEETS